MTMLHTIVAENLKHHASEPAVVYDDSESCVTILYGELQSQIHTLMTEFSRLGVKDSVVGVLFEERSWLVPSVLIALLHNQSPFYPVSVSGVRHTVDTLTAVGVSYVLVHQDLCQNFKSVLECFHYRQKSSQTLQDFDLQLFCIEHSLTDYKKPACSNLAYCITTSGTTSKPKIVRVPHACITPNILQLRQSFQLRPGDKVLMTSPLTFDPSIVDIFCTLSSGACLVMVPPVVKQAPDKLLQVVQKRQKVTVMQATPSLMRTFGSEKLKCTVLGRGSNLRVLALGGEQFPVASELSTWLHPDNKTQLYNLYGITEISCWASCYKVDSAYLQQQDAPVPIGQALDKTLIKLVPSAEETSGSSAIKPEKEMRHILIGSSERVCIIDDEQGNEKAASEVVWRNTGDLGKADSNGNIFCLGRVDTQIKRMGKRLNLSSVENVIKELPEVNNCCATYHREILAVFVLLDQTFTVSEARLQESALKDIARRPDAAQTPEEEPRVTEQPPNLLSGWANFEKKLQNYARRVLPHHAVPDVYVEVQERFPVTSHGKLDKKDLLNLLDDSKMSYAHHFSPSILQDLWKAHLPDLPRDLDSSDNFLTVGGDSLSAIRLATSLQAISPLSMAQIYDILVNKDFCSVFKAMEDSLRSDMPPTNITSGEEQKTLLHYSNGNNGCNKKKIQPESKLSTEVISASNTFDSNGELDTEKKSNESFKASVRDMYFQVNESNLTAENKMVLERGMEDPMLIDINSVLSTSKRDIKNHNGNDLAQKSKKFRNLDTHCCDSVQPTAIIHRGGKIIHPRGRFDSKEVDYSCRIISSCLETGSKSSPESSSKILSQEKGGKVKLHRRWQFNTGKCVDASPLVIQHSESAVFIGSHSGLVSRLDVHTGVSAWSVSLPDRLESSACCTLDGRYLVLGCYDGSIYTLCTSCGAQVWEFPTGDAVKCSPVLNPVSGHVLCGSHDGCLYCLDVQNRRCVWKQYLGGGSVFSSPALDQACHIVHAATLGGHVLALDAMTGEISWKIDLHKPVFASLCECNGRIFVGCVDCRLYCLEKSGHMRWKFETAAPIFSSPAVVQGLCVLFGCHDFCVYCLNSEGRLLWKFGAQATVYATPFPFPLVCGYGVTLRVESTGTCHSKLKMRPFNSEQEVVSANREQEVVSDEFPLLDMPLLADNSNNCVRDCVAVVSTDGKLSLLGCTSGDILVEHTLPGQVFSSPLVVGNNIIVGCRDNFVYGCELT